MTKRRRPLALLMVVCFLLALFFAVAFISVHSEHHHDCHDDQCRICLQIAAAARMLKQLVSTPSVASAMGSVFLLAAISFCQKIALSFRGTLVSLKVRMNN